MEIYDTEFFKNLPNSDKEFISSLFSSDNKEKDHPNYQMMMMLSMLTAKTDSKKPIKISCSAIKTNIGNFSFDIEGTYEEIVKLIDIYIQGITEVTKLINEVGKSKNHWWSKN